MASTEATCGIDTEDPGSFAAHGQTAVFKPPRSDKASAIDKNVRKALHQSKWIIFDSRRMKKVPDATVERELLKSAQTLRSMRRLLFVNRKATVIDIK